MKIFLISQTAKQGYDTYDSAVVVAESAEEAATIYPGWDEDNSYRYYDDDEQFIPFLKDEDNRLPRDWARDPALVNVVEIGEAAGGWKKFDIVCASYSAG